MRVFPRLRYGPCSAPAPPQAFSPHDVDNLALWLDASETSTLTQVSGLVSQWNDKSAHGNHAAQPLAARQPETGVRTINGRNALDFVLGGLDSLNLPSDLHSFPASNFSFFIVAKFDSYGSFNRLVGSNPGFSIVAENASDRWAFYNKNNFSTPAVISPRNTSPHIFYFEKSGTVLRAALDGILGAEGTGTASAVNDLPVGSSSTDPFDGCVAEIILFKRALLTSEINQVGNYLSSKWGIAWTSL